MENGGEDQQLTPVFIPERSDDPFQVATQLNLVVDEDGFFLTFSVVDVHSRNIEKKEIAVHPVAKVFLGRNMMQKVVRLLLNNPAVRELPDLKQAREEAEKELRPLGSPEGKSR